MYIDTMPLYTSEEAERAQKMLDECTRVFVYGTLKRTKGNNVLLDRADVIGAAETKDGFALGRVGCPYAFPADVVPTPYHTRLLWPIQGELYQLQHDDLLTACNLDALEGYPTHYGRRVIGVMCNGNEYNAWIYTMEDALHMHQCDACGWDNGRWVY